jgi:hypothetical protein
MGVFQNNLMGAAAAAASAGGADFYGHQINNSARFTGSGVLSRTAGTPTNVDKFTISCWVKRSKLTTANNFVFGYTDNINYQKLAFNSTDKLELHEQRGAGDSNGLRTVDQVFRDTSAWYNVVWVYDSGNATEADREIFYVNGTRLSNVEGWDGGYPTQNRDSVFNKSGATIHIGSASSYYGSYFQGYMAEVVFNDGQAYAASDYGETKNGVWIPKDPSGLTFGNNGFHLNFASSSDMGNDVSGNNNDFSESGVDTHDQMIDIPTFDSSSNGGNFMTYNGAMVGANNTLSEGNLKSTGTGGGNVEGTFGMITGKWYWECRVEDLTDYGPTFGIGQYGAGGSEGVYNIITWQSAAGQMYGGGGYPDQMGTISVTSTGVTSLADADILSFWLDCDNGKLWIGKNGTIPNSGDPANGTNPQASWSTIPTSRYFMATCQNVSNGIGVLNAGQNPTFNGTITAGTNTDKNGYGLFNYDPSSTDFLACCAANIPTADEIDPAQTDDNYPQKLFSPIIWTGDGTTSRAITGLGFQPDWLWFKARDSAFSHRIYDTSRGIGSTGGKRLFSNTTGAETDITSGQDISAVGTDGFTLGASSNLYTNDTNNDAGHVNWAWRANGGTTSTNSTGSHNATQQVDPTGSFSISTMADPGGAVTVGHGLSKAPSMYIVKGRSGSTSWGVYHEGIGATKYILLETHSAAATGSQYFNDTAPTSSVLSLGATWNGAGTLVVYAFADREGYCKAGSYRGNGLSDAQGTYVYTGFRPAWVMTKATDTGAEWTIYDNKRNAFNKADAILQADLADAERTDLDVIDILSNGFKCLDNGGRTNQSGKSYIYLAFAKNPFQYATAR